MSPALPNAVVVGAMKCGTTALHRYLAAHPQVSMADAKEANFFIGPDLPPDSDPATWWRTGQWHRGLDWYASLFDPSAPVRGESSPAYTSPDHPEAAERMARVVPDARLLYLVRDPVDRAVSQYRHHARDGTERRPMHLALLDPDSQYLARSRYHERIRPFLARYRRDRLLVVVQERLRDDRRDALRRVYAHVGADPDWWDDDLLTRHHVGDGDDGVDDDLRAAVLERVADDLDRLTELVDDDLAEWRT